MHPINKFLSLFGLSLSRINRNIKKVDENEREFIKKYEHCYKIIKNNKRGFKTTKAYRYQKGSHPFKIQDLEFEFAAYHLYKLKPEKILDIGSYRHFILGLLAHYNVTSIDIRDRKSLLEQENIVTCDAKSMKFDDNSFESVISLEALPHFGLGRYGDDFDLDADIKTFNEMVRVLKPGGLLIFSTAITAAQPFIAFNARRNYSYKMIIDFCNDLDSVEEKFINRRKTNYCSLEEITADPKFFDYYIGCWQKKREISNRRLSI